MIFKKHVANTAGQFIYNESRKIENMRYCSKFPGYIVNSEIIKPDTNSLKKYMLNLEINEKFKRYSDY